MLKTRIAQALAALFPGIGPGQTPSLVMNGAVADQTGLVSAILGINPFQEVIYNAAANTSSFTAGASQISGAAQVYLALTGTAGAGVALTLPTVANLIAALPASVINSPVGLSWQLRIINVATTQTVTVTTNTGWTVSGTATIATTVFRDFVVTITSATTATIQAVGAGNA